MQSFAPAQLLHLHSCHDPVLMLPPQQVPTTHGKADITVYRKAGEEVVRVLSSLFRYTIIGCSYVNVANVL